MKSFGPSVRAVDEHGGNIYRAAEEHGLSMDEILDFSASINPLGVPESVISAITAESRFLNNYPDPDAERLRLEITKHYDVNPQTIICGNGSTELIYLVVRALRPGKILIPAPTFSEYSRAVLVYINSSVPGSSHCRPSILNFQLTVENNFEIDADRFITAMEHCDMAFLCNPNNPTGGMLKKDEIMKIADAARELKCLLVVDEAFIDFRPMDSLVDEVGRNPYLIVLRSLTKFYALSGLRIGFAVAPLKLAGIMKDRKEPWTVNTLAQAAGVAALNDESYMDRTFEVVADGKKILEDGFRRLGITCFPSPVNFYLIRLNNAPEALFSLRDKGILVRDCSNFIGLDGSYIRVAVKSGRDNTRLLGELERLCGA